MSFGDMLLESVSAPLGVVLKRITTIALILLALVLVRVTVSMIFEGVDADEILVVQDPFDGELHWYTAAGLKW